MSQLPTSIGRSSSSFATCLLEMHRRRPTTTLFVTHDQQEALMLARRVVVLAEGRYPASRPAN